jgi:mono/diheme cytochrome c family protein
MRRRYGWLGAMWALWAASSLLALACGAALAGAGPPPAPTPPKEPELIDPNDPDPPAAASVSAAPSAPSAPADSVLVEKGRGMYRDYCQKCHGLNMVSPGGGFFDLRTFPHDDKARFVNSVTNGKRAMPAWGAVLRPGDIDTVWAYISSYK